MQPNPVALIGFSIKSCVSTFYVLNIAFSTGTTGFSHLKIKRPTTLGPRDKACERIVLFVTSFLFILHL